MAQLLLRHSTFLRSSLYAGLKGRVGHEGFSSGAAAVKPHFQPEEEKKDLTSGSNWFSALLNPAWAEKVAFRDEKGSFTYNEIASAAFANHLKLEEDFRVEKTIKSHRKTLHGKRIGIFTSHDVSFVISLWSTWLSGGIAVPLGIKHPETQLEYFVKNSDTSVILCSQETQEKARKIAKACGAEILPVVPTLSAVTNPDKMREALLTLAPSTEEKALILYTSGTTGQPKGVLWKHEGLMGQVEGMKGAWQWTSKDVLLHVLPLYHLHGLINCLLTPLACGASVWMDEEFKPAEVWRQLLSEEANRVNIFMGVPTIFVKLLEYFHNNKEKMPSAENVRKICKSRMRLMVSGSAPLPEKVFLGWKELTGHELLERYGMTETGMILTNPLRGPRIPGTVGTPFPQVQARIVATPPEKPVEVPAATSAKSFLGLKTKTPKEAKKQTPPEKNQTNSNQINLNKFDSNQINLNKFDLNQINLNQINSNQINSNQINSNQISQSSTGMSGELQVTGPNMFHAYWNNERATRESFSDDGWFRTGDTAEIDAQGVYRLLGRTSSEIIKSGGFKVSALDVERRVQEHPDVTECAVFGVPDDVWGEKIVCFLALRKNKEGGEGPGVGPGEGEGWKGKNEEDLQKTVADFVAKSLPAYAAPRTVKLVDEVPRNAMGKVNKRELAKNFVLKMQKEGVEKGTSAA